MRKYLSSRMCQNFSDSVSRVMFELMSRSSSGQKPAKLLRKNDFGEIKSNKPFRVVVEGNIGSGKSTFLEHFKKFSDCVDIIDEPVEEWRNIKGHNLLQMMYEDPKR